MILEFLDGTLLIAKGLQFLSIYSLQISLLATEKTLDSFSVKRKRENLFFSGKNWLCFFEAEWTPKLWLPFRNRRTETLVWGRMNGGDSECIWLNQPILMTESKTRRESLEFGRVTSKTNKIAEERKNNKMWLYRSSFLRTWRLNSRINIYYECWLITHCNSWICGNNLTISIKVHHKMC